jgi:peptidoglycan/xylan/chitin deacetylase (PgdA/CDA1 family)
MTMDALAIDGGWREMARSVRRTMRRTRNRIRQSSVILLYHRVAEGFADPWSLCVAPANFREQMAVLAARGVRPLDGLLADLAAGHRARSVVVTFDDGYADFCTTALPMLRAHGVPTTLFVTTGTLGGGAEFWWDELERTLLVPPTLPGTLSIAIGTEAFSWHAGDGDRRALYHALHQRLGRLGGTARARALADLRAWAAVDDRCRATHRPLTAAELAAVAREPDVQLGAHTVSHSYLGALAGDEQAREIEDSKRSLEAIAGRSIEHFSYPHGDHEPETVACVRAAGFRAACGSACAPVVGEVDAFDLPRVEVPNFSGAAFARWLDDWAG